MVVFLDPTEAEAIATKFPEISMIKGATKHRMSIDSDAALDLIDWLCDEPFEGAVTVVRLLTEANDDEMHRFFHTGEWTL